MSIARLVARSSLLAAAGVAALDAPRLRAQSIHPDPPPTVRAVRRNGDIVIDGSLDEPAWRDAPAATGLRQQDPDPGAPATQRTEVRFLYDADALYIGARMYDTRGAAGVATRLVRRDQDPGSDNLMIILDTFHDHAGRTVFRVNPSGVKDDSRGLGTADPDPSWDAVWEVATRIDSLGWTAEIRIPFSQLQFPRDSVQTWGLQLWRYEQHRNETSQWAYWTKRQSGGPAFFGHLVGLRVPTAAHHVELLPYGVVTERDAALGDAAGAPAHRRVTTYRAGGDARYLLTPNLALDATVNPDFGQVEVDPAVLNLTAFETFYPEKRPFFVAGAGLFQFGTVSCFTCANATSLDLFYSRRIGRAPQLTPPGSTLDAPASTRVLGAAKLIGQTAGGLSLGVVDAVTAEERASVLDPAGTMASVPVEPLTNYFAARATQRVPGRDLAVGGMLTAVRRAMPTAALAALLPRSAVAGGADVDWWWGAHTYHLQSSVAASYVGGDSAAMRRVQESSARYFQRPDRVAHGRGLFGDAYDPTATTLAGYAAFTRVAKDAGDWMWEGALDLRSPGFEVNDMGYLPTADAAWMLANLERSFTRPTRYFRSLSLIAGAQQQLDFDGDLVGRELHGAAAVTLPNYWTVAAGHSASPAVLDDRATRGGPLVMDPARRSDSLSIATDARAPLVVTTAVTASHDADGGHATAAGATVLLKPMSNVALTLAPSVSWATSEAQYVATVPDSTARSFFGHRYVFARVTQRTLALAMRIDVTFTPSLSLDAYAQPFLASGAYAGFEEYLAPRSLRRSVYGRDAGTITRSDSGPGYTIDPDGTGPAPSFSIADPSFTLRSWRSNAVLRWEYRPGCTLYLVWTQTRRGAAAFGDLDLARDGPALFRQRPDNVVLLKVAYWLGR